VLNNGRSVEAHATAELLLQQDAQYGSEGRRSQGGAGHSAADGIGLRQGM